MTSKRCLLFDLDGTLVDSAPAHARAFIRALEPMHPNLARHFNYSVFAGRPTREVFTALGLGSEPEVAILTQQKQTFYREALERGDVGIFAGVPALLDRLQGERCRMFIVTGASRKSALRVLELLKLGGYFEGVITADDTPLGKPSPEPYLFALSAHGLSATECLAIEDGESGVRSAQAAGVEVVLIHSDLDLANVRHVGNAAGLAKLLLE